MALLYLLFSKFVPMISIWEIEGRAPAPRRRPSGRPAEGKHHGLVLEGPLPTDVAE